MVRPSYNKKTLPYKRRTTIMKRKPTYVPRSLGNPKAYGESKYYETDYGPQNIPAIINSWATINAVNFPNGTKAIACPTRGSESFDREGRMIKVHSVRIHGLVTVPFQGVQLNPDTTPMIRGLLVLDTQCNGTQTNGDQVLASSTGSTGVFQIHSFMNIGQFGRFKVLKEFRMYFPPLPIAVVTTTNLVQSGCSRPLVINHVFKKPLIIHFNSGNTGTVGDIVDNNIFMMVGCNEIGTLPSLQWRSRIKFTEE